MKSFYRIGFIFMSIAFICAIIIGYGYYKFVYNDNKETTEDLVYNNAIETSDIKDITTCDTEYIILEQDLVSGESKTLVETIPAQYIGKTKKEILKLIDTNELAPSLRDKEKGLKSVKLSAYSPHRIVIVKSFEKQVETIDVISTIGNKISDNSLNSPDENNGIPLVTSEESNISNNSIATHYQDTGCYYLMACDGLVYVYLEDMITLYLPTDITVTSLPYELRNQIMDRKFMNSEEELYNFLESYSS